MQKKKIILLVAGGTGGHFLSAVAVAQNLSKNLELEIHISTDNRCKKYFTDNFSNISLHIIDLYLNCRGIINKMKVPFLVFLSLIKALFLIKKLKPNLIMGFGGYPSFPLMFMGQLMSIPTIVYEQNSFLGKSNKFFARKAAIIILAYQNTQNLASCYLNKVLIIGHSIRDDIKKLNSKRNFSNMPFNLLIIGGSQGAKIFSTLIPESIKILLKNHPGTNIKVIQQVCSSDKGNVKRIYDNLNVESIISDFFFDIHNHYDNSQLVIARAGAATIAELTEIGLPAIFIPFPFSTDEHQYYNAKFLQDSNCSWCYKESEITAEILANKVYNLIKNRSLLKKASVNLLKQKIDHTRRLASIVMKTIN